MCGGDGYEATTEHTNQDVKTAMVIDARRHVHMLMYDVSTQTNHNKTEGAHTYSKWVAPLPCTALVRVSVCWRKNARKSFMAALTTMSSAE